jgi:adenylate kinase
MDPMDDQIKTVSNWLGRGSINIFGRPFSGKDTQGRILADLFYGAVIGGGDILRSHKDPAEIERVMAGGGIIPSDFYLNLLLPYLSQPEFRDKPLMLSAVGRAHGEEPVIMKAAVDSGHPIMAVVLLKLSEEEVWQRFKIAQVAHDRGDRSDDQFEVLKTRLKKFEEKTVPVIEYYRDKNLLIEIDGTLTREGVTGEIIQSLANRAAM